jgi:hypothetical protein
MQRINSNFRFSRRLIKTHMACSNAGVPVFALSVSMAFTLHTGIHGQCFQQQNEQKLCCAGWEMKQLLFKIERGIELAWIATLRQLIGSDGC